MMHLPQPDQERLEDLTAQLLTKVFGCPEPATRYGRSGQKQHGIDVVARMPDGMLVAAQCKAYNSARLRQTMLEKDLAAAHAFDPPLDRLIVVTSTPRDKALHEWALDATLHGKRQVQVWFWDDVIELLREHGLLGSYVSRVVPADVLMQAFRAVGLTTTASVTDGSPNTASDASPEVRELQRLLVSGRATVVIERLVSVNGLDESRAFVLARAYVQRRQHEEARVVLAGLDSVRSLALASLVHARLGETRVSEALIARARNHAGDGDRPYVVAMDLMRQLAVDPAALDWSRLLDAVPPAVRQHPTVLGALADVAAALDRYDEAIACYQAAEAADDRPSALRRLAILASRLARVLASLPSGDLVANDSEHRRELEAIMAALNAEDREDLDRRPRAVIQNNLHVAALSLGDFAECLAYIRRAVDLDPGDVVLWRRWALAALFANAGLDRERIGHAPPDPMLDMMLSQLEANVGDRAAALARIDRALGTSDLAPDIAARLHAHRIVIGSPDGTLGSAEGEQLLALERVLAVPAPAIVRIAAAIDAPGMREVAERFLAWLQESSLDGLEDDDKLALVAGLVERGHANSLSRFLPLLRSRLARPDGTLDRGIAPLLIAVLVETGRLHEAASAAARFADSGSAQGRFLRASVLSRLGDDRRALDELLECSDVTRRSPALLHLCVVLARHTGRLRELQRAVRKWELPTPRSATEHRALHVALALLRDRRRSALAAETLRATADFETVAATLFALGIRAGMPAARHVSADALVTIALPDGGTADYWTGPSASPLPTVVHVPWIGPVLGRRIGDDVRFDAGPFAGKTLKVVATKRPDQLLLERAATTARATGDIRSVEGGTDALVERIRNDLREQRQMNSQRLSAASSAAVPASAMAELLGRPARIFLRADGGWNPRCGTGTERELTEESAALRRVRRWVIDPATACLIVECGLERVFASEGVRPWVSAQTRHVLRQWQLSEHDENRGRRGWLHLTDSGRLVLIETSADARLCVTGFWARLRAFVDNLCELAPAAEDDEMARLCHLTSVLDVGSISTVAIARKHHATVLSDELAVRIASGASGVDCASLRGALLRAVIERRVAMTDVVNMFAALASTGRGFISLPFDLLRHAVFRIPSQLRHPRAKVMLSTLTSADPRTTWPPLLVLLLINQRRQRVDRRAGMSERRLLRLVLRYAPKPDPELAIALRSALIEVSGRPGLTELWSGQGVRTLNRALARYLAQFVDG